MKRLSIFMIGFFLLSMLSVNVYAAEPIALSIPLPLTGGEAKFGEMPPRRLQLTAQAVGIVHMMNGTEIDRCAAGTESR